MMKIETLHTFDTEYSADSLEWCPHSDYLEYFVCGTYQLDDTNENSATQAPCRRKGRIYLFQYEFENDTLKELDRIETAAILDMKWLNNLDSNDVDKTTMTLPILGTANALGEIHIYQLETNKLTLQHSFQLNANDENLLALSLEWSTNSISELDNNYKLIVSDSKGSISLLNYDGISLQKISTWSAHNFEAWTCTFDKWNPNRIFTGGDDITLNSFDIRDTVNVIKSYTNHSHCAGITAMLSHPKMENILLTGSYDDHLRAFDTRHMKNSLKELNLEGGIWRIRADPITEKQNLILCACMYKNFSFVNLLNDDMKLEGVYEEHESICYGSDWCIKSKDYKHNLIVGTCSFYDHKMCISRVNYTEDS